MKSSSVLSNDIADIIKSLEDRPKEIIVLRFGLGPDKKRKTLNQIGEKYSITRERVRQVQNSTLKQIRKKSEKKLKSYLEELKQIMIDYGNVMAEKHILPEAFKHFKLNNKEEDLPLILFLLSLGEEFLESKRTQKYNKFWFLEKGKDKQVKKIVSNFIKEINSRKEALKRESLFESVASVAEKELNRKLTINELRAILNLSRELKRNSLNMWGHKNWSEITPKNAGDFAYLTILSEGKALHFNDIANKSLKKRITKNKLHSPTIHNVLIKDPRFVLIGKGKYALKKWGYKPGTVIQLVEEMVKNNGGEIDKECLINEILKQREVKRSTILLNINRSQNVTEQGNKLVWVE